MSAIKAVIFDVVGTTVLETDPEVINDCFNQAFKNSSIEVCKSDILRVRGKDKREAIDDILKQTGHPMQLGLKVYEQFQNLVKSRISNFGEHPDFYEVLRFLKGRDIFIGIGSGLPAAVFYVLIEHLNWQRYTFHYSEVFENLEAGRPAPYMIYDMCAKLSLTPDQILKIGDTVSDIQEGKNAGALTGAVLSGTQPKELLVKELPDFIFNSLADLPSVF